MLFLFLRRCCSERSKKKIVTYILSCKKNKTDPSYDREIRVTTTKNPSIFNLSFRSSVRVSSTLHSLPPPNKENSPLVVVKVAIQLGLGLRYVVVSLALFRLVFVALVVAARCRPVLPPVSQADPAELPLREYVAA